MKSDIISDPAKYHRGWSSGLPETKCGYGSKFRQTVFQRQWIPDMVAKHGIRSIADLGAGDLNWSARTAFGCTYTPYDLIPRAHGVEKLDILTDELPAADCLMVLWVLNHFPPEMQEIAIRKLQETNARFLMMTWDNKMEPCADLVYVEKEVLRKAVDGRDLEIRLIKL